MQNRDYKAIYRAVFDFHRRYTHAIYDDLYWDNACEELIRIAADFWQDPLLIDLLAAVFAELEREHAADAPAMPAVAV